jgi:fatty-acyl-CoA synthase
MTGLWPRYAGSADLAEIERIPWQERDLPASSYDIVRRAARARPDAPAHLTLRDGASWEQPVVRTYAELLDEIHAAANALVSLGVGRREAVGLLSVNTAELVPALLAAEAVAIAAPINPALAAHEVAGLLRRAEVGVLVAAGPELEPRIWSQALELAKELGLRAVLALRPTGATGEPPPLEQLPGVVVEHLGALAAPQPADRLLVDPPVAGELAAFFHTGGTTGTPKLAAHTHRMQVVDAWAIALGSTAQADAAFFAALPLFHVNALLVTTLAPAMRAQPVVWAGPLGYRDPALMRSFWRIVERYGVTAMSGVPTVYAALCQVPVDADISSLALAIVGAAPLPAAVADRWHAHTGVGLCEGYGLTEATCASARSFPLESRAGYVGQRFPYQEIAVLGAADADGRRPLLPPGEVGAVAIRGPVVFPGYVVGWGDEGPVLDAGGRVVDGWLDTGDLGAMSADGWLRLVGRSKDVIIRGGHNIDPAPVEALLLEHPDVVDAGVVGRPDARSGEVPVAFVVVRDADGGAATDTAAIKAWAAARAPEPAAAPSSVTVLPLLPVTAVGKPDKVALRVLAAQEELGRALREAGVDLGAQGAWCTAEDGVVKVRLRLEGARAAAAGEVLAGYALDARVEVTA